MKKKIFFIRSANGQAVEQLINYINDKYNNEDIDLYCLIQKSSVKSFNEKYPCIKCIESEDGFFKYSIFKNNKELLNKFNDFQFDVLYIPSSYGDYPDFNEVFLICSKIKNNKTILYNCYGEIIEKKLNFASIWIDKNLGGAIYFFKILFALIGISLIYLVCYPYYFVKRKFFDNI
ncbi:hypothetical protein FDA95_08860 [Clostridium botulinum]|uniref:hypothetical protein n=1 Tax=Clostridium botulinum TaxID=1491 RepID=UPI0013FA479A|nr:hypothetical protein [Clostridium botulinum]MCJ8172280.1 hypothetical protein [Clostridium botulinum]NFK78711.1 hypothetical protein [Clostridium botulinum]BDB02542.1 hypothetical protein CBOS2020_26160 [Clostridium botulinum]